MADSDQTLNHVARLEFISASTFEVENLLLVAEHTNNEYISIIVCKWHEDAVNPINTEKPV